MSIIMSTKAHTNRITRIGTIQKLASGFKLHGSKMGDLVVDTGDKVAGADVTHAFDAVVQADATVATARGGLDAALLAEEQTLATTKAIIDAVKHFALIMFAKKPDV